MEHGQCTTPQQAEQWEAMRAAMGYPACAPNDDPKFRSAPSAGARAQAARPMSDDFPATCTITPGFDHPASDDAADSDVSTYNRRQTNNWVRQKCGHSHREERQLEDMINGSRGKQPCKDAKEFGDNYVKKHWGTWGGHAPSSEGAGSRADSDAVSRNFMKYLGYPDREEPLPWFPPQPVGNPDNRENQQKFSLDPPHVETVPLHKDPPYPTTAGATTIVAVDGHTSLGVCQNAPGCGMVCQGKYGCQATWEGDATKGAGLTNDNSSISSDGSWHMPSTPSPVHLPRYTEPKAMKKAEDSQQDFPKDTQSVNVSRTIRHWSSVLMAMVTLATLAGTSAFSTLVGNAATFSVIAGVASAGIVHPHSADVWNLDQLRFEDLIPSTSYEDIFLGPTKAHNYSYEVGLVTEDVAHIIERQYVYNDHDAAEDNRLTIASEAVFAIPIMHDRNDYWTNDQFIDSVRDWRVENRAAKVAEYDSKSSSTSQRDQFPEAQVSAVQQQRQLRYPLHARMDDRKLEFSDEIAEEAACESVSAVVRGPGVDAKSKPLWDQLDCNASPWCVKHAAKVKTLLQEVKGVFDCDGKQPPFINKEGKVVEVPIHLTDDEPVAQRAWRLSPEKLAVLDKYIDELLEQGVIQPTKYSPYSAVTVLVPKKGQLDKDGRQKLRVTTDYRRLNRKIRALAYNGATTQDLFDMVDGATHFSTYDVSSAFYNLKLRADAREKTAFSTPHRGLFEYLRLPMGLSISPSVLAGEYEEIWRVPVTINGKYYPCALGAIVGIYCDDVLAFSNEENHFEVNQFVLRTLLKHRVNIRADKCFIGHTEVDYLGMKISGDGISISPEKCKSVWQAKVPTSVEETRRFLGMASYLRSFIPNFAQHTLLMTKNLSKSETVFKWTPAHDEEYNYILSCICSDNCLAPFSWGKESILRTDSSAGGYGAVLCQMHGKIRRPVCFLSKQLTPTEGKRPGRDLEIGCLTWACQKLRHYLIHRPFVVHGDCSNAQWIHKYDGDNRRLYNYSLILSQYQMRFEYKRGSTMHDCDWLSRSALHSDKNDEADPDLDTAECGSDLQATPLGNGRVSTLKTTARQPRQGARNTYHCCLKGTSACSGICPQFSLAPNNKLYCNGCMPLKWKNKSRSVSVSDWDRHAMLTKEYRQREHWHRLGWSPDEHNNDHECDWSCPCCRSAKGECFNSCPVCNETKYGDARPVWDFEEVTLEEALNKRTAHFKEPVVATKGAGYPDPPKAAPKRAKVVASKKFVPEQYAQSQAGIDAAAKAEAKTPDGVATSPALPRGRRHANVSAASMSPRPAYKSTTVHQDDQYGSQGTRPRGTARIGATSKWPKSCVKTDIFTHKSAVLTKGADRPDAIKVITINDGFGTDDMALQDADRFRITAAAEVDDLKSSKLYTARTGIIPHHTVEHLRGAVRTGTIQSPDVLSFTGDFRVRTTHAELTALVEDWSPPVILLASSVDHSGDTRDEKETNRNAYVTVEKILHDRGYLIDSRTINAAEHGGYVAQVRYFAVAHHSAKGVEWPEEAKKFQGLETILQHAHTVDPRTRRHGYQDVEVPSCGNFLPWRAGYIKGGGAHRSVHDINNPLPDITTHYNKFTGENGAQFIVDSEGTRLLTATEQMRALHFDDKAVNQLQDETRATQQHCIGRAGCVNLKAKLFEAIEKLLDTTTSGNTMPSDRAVAGLLAHAVMPSIDEISAAQKNDPDLALVRKYVQAEGPSRKELESTLPPKYKRHAEYMHLARDALFYRDILNDEWMTNAIVIPPTMIERALEAFHDSGYAGHQGFNKTLVAIMERVWFPKMRTRVRDHIDNCDACRRSKAIRRKHAGKSQSQLFLQPWEVVSIDLVGPFLKSSDGNCFVFHAIDMFTNYNVAVAIPNKEMATVAKAFHDSLIIGGPCTTPTACISDRGSEFLNKLYLELTEQFNIRHYKCTALHPTGNATCERQHRTYNAIFKTMLHKYGKQFDEALDYATYAINTAAIEGTHISPYEMHFGRKPKDPNAVAATDHPEFTASKSIMEPAEHIKMLRERMAEAQTNQQMSRLQVLRKNQQQMSNMHYEKHYNVGDLLLRWTGNTKRGLYGKLAYTTVGPFEVVSIHKHNRGIYELQHVASPDKGTSMHHVRELCPYLTKEAYLKQKPHFAVNTPLSKMEPEPGDLLLLANGSRDFVCKVISFKYGQVQFQYYNKEKPGKGLKEPYHGLNLVWHKNSPSSNPFSEGACDDSVEIYQEKLTPKQVAEGFRPYEDTISLDEFYQRPIDAKSFKKEGNGYKLNHAKRMVIRKCKPSHMQGP